MVSSVVKSLIKSSSVLGSMGTRNFCLVRSHTAKWMQDTSKKSPMELINEVPPIKVEGRIVACEGMPIPHLVTRLNSYALTFMSRLSAMCRITTTRNMAVIVQQVPSLDKSPYCHLSKVNWGKVTGELTRQFCNILGQSYESPLSMTIAVGVQGLPPLLKFMNIMVRKRNEWQTMKQLLLPVELDHEFQFHSVFVCSVSKAQVTEENPPMLMSCGHVLCKQSITKVSKNGTKTLKCPYCPSDIDSAQCRQLFFCCICGVIDRRIDTIFEFQYNKGRTLLQDTLFSIVKTSRQSKYGHGSSWE